MEAPSVRIRSKVTHIAFEQQPPRLVRWGFHASPFDFLMVGMTSGGAVCRIEFARNRKPAAILEAWAQAWPRAEFIHDKKAVAQIMKKILGKKSKSNVVALYMTGTDFQQKVWKELLKVPSGETVSYAELARRIKKPRAMRAVGNAMGANPVPLLMPCHRVIASGGRIGGFGSGLDLKRKLLAAEDSKVA